jgi:hypothetical protein
VDIDNQSMETTSGVMNAASDIVILESHMHKVTFANVPLRVFNLDGQGAGEFCLEMDTLHLISSLFPSHKSEFDLTSRQKGPQFTNDQRILSSEPDYYSSRKSSRTAMFQMAIALCPPSVHAGHARFFDSS